MVRKFGFLLDIKINLKNVQIQNIISNTKFNNIFIVDIEYMKES